MALNFTVSYTFAPNTTIQSSQVNTNTSDVANVFIGLENLTKTFAKLKVDVDPSTALEVATKQYVDHYSNYRRPSLVYSSGTVINIETGINGTSGQAQILFPDGNLRMDSTSGRINCNLAQVAALSGTAQSGLQTGTVAANTAYAVYAVKVSDNSSNFVLVADLTNLPLLANFATLNSNFGTNSWVYLGMVFYGDNSGSTTAIVPFIQNGNLTFFNNAAVGQALNSSGIRMATTASASSIIYTYSAGVTAGKIPGHLKLVYYSAGGASGGSGVATFTDSAASIYYGSMVGTQATYMRSGPIDATGGAKITNGSAIALDIWLDGYIDPVLGVGPNPLL